MMRSQYNDAVYSIRKAVQAARTLLSNCTGVFNYHTFETKYQLTWGTTAEPPPFTAGPRAVPVPDTPVNPFSLDEALDMASQFTDAASRARFLRPYMSHAERQGRTGEIFAILTGPPPLVPAK
jgi:hypothetical protein